MRSRIILGGLTAALGLSGVLVTTSADAGSSARGTGCGYPYVCL